MEQLKENSDATNFWQFDYKLALDNESIYERLVNIQKKKTKKARKNTKSKIEKAVYEKPKRVYENHKKTILWKLLFVSYVVSTFCCV
jgi:hypothetical protein